MHRLKLIGIRALAVVALAVVVVVGLATFSGPRDASAAVPDPTGVFCARLTVGNGIVIVRIELDFEPKGIPNDVAFTAVQYTPRGAADCQAPGGLPAADLIPQTAARPQIQGIYDAGTRTISATLCQENINFGGAVIPGWSEIDVDFSFNNDPGAKSVDADAFTLTVGVDAITCAGGVPLQIGIDNGVWLDGPGGDPTTFSSNWDGDTCRDWDELAEFGASDPFNPDDCKTAGVVGGVAEIVDTDSAPLDATSSSGTSAWLIAAIAAAVAGTIALGGTAVFARRRAGR